MIEGVGERGAPSPLPPPPFLPPEERQYFDIILLSKQTLSKDDSLIHFPRPGRSLERDNFEICFAGQAPIQ